MCPSTAKSSSMRARRAASSPLRGGGVGLLAQPRDRVAR